VTRGRTRVATVVVAIAVVLATPVRAGAQSGNRAVDAASGTGGGTFGGTPPELGVGLLVTAPGTADGGGHDVFHAGDPAAPRPVFARAIPADSGDGNGIENLCRTPAGPTGPEYAIGNGWNFFIELFATVDGRYLGSAGVVCQPLAGPASDGPPDPPDVPQPPTIGEIWRAAGLAAPAIGTNPEVRGVTGLPTWVWTGSAAPVTVAVALDGYRITGRASVVGYGGYSGEGRWTRSDAPGDANDPAFTHTYETRGTYRLGVATIWNADAVMTGPGLATPLSIDLGSALVTNARDYPVVSVRSVLTP